MRKKKYDSKNSIVKNQNLGESIYKRVVIVEDVFGWLKMLGFLFRKIRFFDE